MPHTVSGAESPDTGVISLVIACRMLGIAAEPDQLHHRFGETGQTFTETDILRAARFLGLKSRSIQSNWDRLSKTTLPAIAQHEDGHFFVIAKMDEEKVLIQDPLEKRPLALPRDIFEKAWNGRLILLTRRALLFGEDAKFGFKWFIPAIKKYKHLFIEVLAASFLGSS